MGEGNSLFLLECLIFNTGLIALDTNDDLDSLLWGQEPSIGWGIGEEEPEKYRGDECQDTGDADQPLPGLEARSLNVCTAEGHEAQEDDGKAVHENWKWALEERHEELVRTINVHQYPVLCICSVRV